MKKLASLLLAGLMSVSLVACGGGDNKPAEESSKPSAEASDMKVAMVTDYGDITDESFNQFTYEACKKFAEENNLGENGFTYYKPAGDKTEERVAMVEKAVADGYNVIVLPGFAFDATIAEVADEYPDTKFFALDIDEDAILSKSKKKEFDYKNVYSAVYQEELPGYMAGYAAVKMGYKKLGYLGGMAVPSVVKYGHGFVQGASDAADELDEKIQVNYAYGNQFYGDADITAAMDTWAKGGTEIIFAAGGGIYTSACEALTKTNGKVIGVDVDQSFIIDKKYGEGMTVTSAMKGLQATVKTVLTAIRDGKWESEFAGKVQRLGIVSDKSSENYVGLPETTKWNDGFTEDDYNALVAKLHAGEIKVDDAWDHEEPVTYNKDRVTVDYQGNIK